MTTTVQDELTEKVIGLAMKVHNTLGPGFVEFVYRNALIRELTHAGISVEVERSLKVYYDEAVVGEFRADLWIDNWLICELKAVQTLQADHEIQVVNYLSATKQEFGLLMNFGSKRLQVKRKYQRRITNDVPADLLA